MVPHAPALHELPRAVFLASSWSPAQLAAVFLFGLAGWGVFAGLALALVRLAQGLMG